MAYPVKWFHSNMQGAPVVNNANGDLTAFLDACLVNGFNLKTVASITRASQVATVTIAAGHLFEVDQIVRVSGADQAEYNGDHRVVARTSTTLTFAVTGSPATPATGATITIKTSPLDWEIAFTGTNKRAYRSTNVASNRPYLRVDDSLASGYNASYAKRGKIVMCEGMSDIDTPVGKQAPFNSDYPTRSYITTGSGGSVVDGWFKWYYAANNDGGSNKFENYGAPSGIKSWALVGDDRGFYFTMESSSGTRTLYMFTDFKSYRASDAYNTLLVADDAYISADTVRAEWNSPATDYGTASTRTIDSRGKLTMAAHTQMGYPVNMFFTTLGTRTDSVSIVSGYSTGIPWPNGPDYAMIMHPVYLHEATTNHMRGMMPGFNFILNNSPTIPNLTIVDGVGDYAGKKFLILAARAWENSWNNANQARVAFDITGPWW